MKRRNPKRSHALKRRQTDGSRSGGKGRKRTGNRPMTSQRSSVGGAAASLGETFQRNVAAWLATLMLADEAPPWDLPASTRLKSLWCQAPSVMDDIVVQTSVGGFIFIQAKRSLGLSNRPTSPLARAIEQAVRQFLEARSGAWNRRLTPDRDRLVLAVGSTSSASATRTLASVLLKVRRLDQGTSLSAAAANTNERRALRLVLENVRRSWPSGSAPTADLVADIKKDARDVESNSISNAASTAPSRGIGLPDFVALLNAELATGWPR